MTVHSNFQESIDRLAANEKRTHAEFRNRLHQAELHDGDEGWLAHCARMEARAHKEAAKAYRHAMAELALDRDRAVRDAREIERIYNKAEHAEAKEEVKG